MFMSDLVFFLDFLIWVQSVAVRLVCLQTPICISSACKLCLHRYNWRNVDCLQVCVNSQHNFVSREINNCVGHTRGAWTGLYLHRYLLSLLRVFTELFAYNSSYESSYARLIKFSKDSLGLRLFLCCGAGGREVSISTLTATMSVML